MLPENDLIVFRRGMYATYGKKVRYYVEKKLAARTKIPAPEMPTIRVDPTVAHNSLRVIAAAEAEGNASVAPDSSATASSHGMQQPADAFAPGTRRLNRAAIEAARAAPPGERTTRLFEHLVAVGPSASG